MSAVHSTNSNINDESVIANTKYGPVEGRRMQLDQATLDADVYRGIPYAKAPVRELRFEVSADNIQVCYIS